MASPAADAPMTSMNATGLPLPPAPAPAGLLAGAPLSTWLLTAFVGYALLCQALRFRREKAMRARYGYPDRASLKHMTTEHAQAIIADLYQLEFPQFSVLSLQFGLFKTYGVESISRLLLATRNLTDPVNSLKRYEDTAVMIGEFSSNPPNSARALAAIARMNYLHSKYVAAGQISNADLLYTLSVFVTEPARFMRLFEWRALNEMEHCAYGAFWKSIGDAMGIEYDGYLARAGRWEDGLDFAADITAWAKRYEVTAFVPSMTSHQPAVALIPMITYWVPAFAKPFAEECVTVLLGDRVREAFVLPEPGLVAATVTYTALLARRFVLRHLALPRRAALRRHHARGCESPDLTDAPIHTTEPYGNYPFYVRPTLWNRWLSPLAWALRLKGGALPGDDPAQFFGAGFRFDELGPRARMGQGRPEMAADVARLRARAGGRGMTGCPFG